MAKQERLVERIVHEIEMYHRWASQRTIYHDTSQKIAMGIIILVFSAIRDGLSFELIEEIAALEHEQWITWSKAVADEVGDERRERWEKYWVPYEELSEEIKEHDRVWARKIIALCEGETEDLDKWIGEDIEAEIRRQFPDG